MEKNKLIHVIRENLEDGKLACERAYSIAGEYKVELSEIGRICNEEKIKIKGCQLGCF